MTSSNLNRFTKILVLGAIVAGAAAPAAGAVARPPDISDAASSLAGSYVGRPPDVRDAAAHLTVLDAFERYTASHPYGKGVSSPQQVGIPFYTPKMLAAHFDREALLYQPRPSISAVGPFYTPEMLAAHFNREARLYQPRPSVSAVSDTTVASGFHWSDWAIGLGSGIGLILALGGGFAISRQCTPRADGLDSGLTDPTGRAAWPAQ